MIYPSHFYTPTLAAGGLVALGLRPNRIKNRDLWDIAWLRQQAVELPLPLVSKKIADHKQTAASFAHLLTQRMRQLRTAPSVAQEFQMAAYIGYHNVFDRKYPPLY